MRFNRLTLTVVGLLVVSICAAQETNFRFKRKIKNVPTTTAWRSIFLPSGIYEHINPDFSDLRIYEFNEGDTTEVPYVVDILDNETKTQEVILPSINESRKDGNYYITFQNENYKVNYLALTFQEVNYFATVKVEGSNDRKQWLELSSNEKIFAVNNAQQSYAYSIVKFPLTDYKYLKLTISSKDRLTLTTATFHLDEFKPGVFNDIPVDFSATNNKKYKNTFIDIRLPDYGPVSFLNLAVANDVDYYRQLKIEALIDSVKSQKGWVRNYETIADELITSFRPNEYFLPYTLTNQLRLTIDNGDNPPLTIKSVTVRRVRVQLRARLTGKEAYAFYGNNKISKPNYDINNFKEKIPVENPEVSLDHEEPIAANDGPTMKAMFESKLWLWAIILLLIAVLGFFTLRMMKTNPS